MLFNSIEFLIFFPVVTILFFALPHKWRWFHLLVSSCIFYMYFIPIYILILFATIVIDYAAGIWIENAKGRKRKWFLIISLIANVGVLAIFKYYNFFIENINETGLSLPLLNILLPIGLSFHTFQAMSYTIEVYRGNHPAERHFGIYALYVMFYPQLVAGPIERPQNILYQFHERKYFNYDNVTSGLRLMAWGMAKKVVVADRLALFTDPIFDNPYDYPGITIAIGAAFFAFQIFCDFSGYSDIALGAARVMGFHLMTNFDKPYHSRSISEFWKRWHISLSTWFRDYLYIPLGGNRVSIPRMYFNLFFVFLISGLWHGANWTFIIWGALHGFFLVFALLTANWRNVLTKKLRLNHESFIAKSFDIVLVFILVTVAWVFFRANKVGDAFYMVGKMLDIPADLSKMYYEGSFRLLNIMSADILLCATLIMALEVCHLVDTKTAFAINLPNRPTYFRWSLYVLLIASILLLGLFNSSSFIYFQF